MRVRRWCRREKVGLRYDGTLEGDIGQLQPGLATRSHEEARMRIKGPGHWETAAEVGDRFLGRII